MTMMLPQITNPHRVLIQAGMWVHRNSDCISFELLLTPDEAAIRYFRGEGPWWEDFLVGEQRVPAKVATDFIAGVNAVIGREDRFVNWGRSGTQYHARISEGPAGTAHLLEIDSDDLTREVLREVASDPAQRPEVAEYARSALARDPFNRAYAVFRLAQAFAHALGYDVPPPVAPRYGD